MRGDASRTAVLVCQGRAAAHDRIAVGRFSDPVAICLLRDDERAVVDQVRVGAAPKGMAARLDYEFVRGCAELMAPRTVAIDDAIRERITKQLVILGAGLDCRAWRMAELGDTVAWEVDHPATQADKRVRLGDRAPAAQEVRFLPCDFARDDLGDGLHAAGQRSDVPTTWVWEGVVPYLTAAQVADTLAVIAARSAPGSRLVINYQRPSARAAFGQLIGRLMMRLAGTSDPWHDEPHRSHWTPEQFAALLAAHGFPVIRDENLLQISTTLGLQSGGGDLGGSLPSGQVLVADRQ